MDSSIPQPIQSYLKSINARNNIDMESYLNPQLKDLPRPEKMKGIDDAVAVIIEMIEQGGEFFIWGDYDVDGTTATALLVNFFRELGVEPHWHIPNRLTDGYGLHSTILHDKLDAIENKNILVITVDCGISNWQEVAEILEYGAKVIVTDHHQLPLSNLPDCIILNPSQTDCGLADDDLAGVGVAFYLAAALRSALDIQGYFVKTTKPNLKEYLGFVALGTISDLVNITSTNRVLVRAGMEALGNSSIAGLKSLMESVGIHKGPLTTEDVSFTIGPRINAAGRLGSAQTAVELMTCDNLEVGAKMARKLNKYNEDRKKLCAANLESALTLVDRYGLSEPAAIVVAGDFHPGVIGIVAAKIVEMHSKPAIVFSRETLEDDSVVFRGSGRSVSAVHLLECLHSCSGYIAKYGGHAMAAGMTVNYDKFETFAREFAHHVELAKLNVLHEQQEASEELVCSVDNVMSKEGLSYLLKLEPFGPQNEKPIFTDLSATIANCRVIGASGLHLQLTIRGKFRNYRAVGFGLGKKYHEVRENPQRRISFTPMINRYHGSMEWQLRIVDI